MNKNIFYKIVSPYSMTSKERIDCLFDSLEYIKNNNIIGDYVECGVWKGGNILGILKYLEYYQNFNNDIYLYDTFSGMTTPEEIDVDLNSNKAKDILQNVLCYSSLEEVKNNLSISNIYPKEKIKFIVGDVCKTLDIKENLPDKISLLRLDTDWYSSTKKELEILWDKLVQNGILIIDDYGHWNGCKKAVDEFFQNKNYTFEKIDYTGIRIIKNK